MTDKEKRADSPASSLPEGTVTFLFTDIEGSTNLLQRLGDKYISLLDDHHRILREIFAKWNGREVDTEGDAFFVSFPKATEAVAAVVEAQRTLASYTWPEGATVRVRMGLHTGEPWTGSGRYVGIDVHRAARIAHAGYGGQVLLSETTAPLIIDDLPIGVSLLDLGRHRLKDIARPEHIRQLVLDGLPSEFPPLKSLEALGSEVLVDQDVRLPAFLEEELVELPMTVFVGRDFELDRLNDALDKSFEGHGSVFFVTGDAGSGKTALLDAAARLAQERMPELLAVRGTCNAFTGSGDPYAPFRTVLRQLTGDVETAWKTRIISKEAACRLWSLLPETARIIVKHGPNLIDTFIPGPALADRVNISLPSDGALHEQVKELVEGIKSSQGFLAQQGLFEEVRDVLAELSAQSPLLLLLDDMQWADNGSINLLFYLARELIENPVLMVGTYRPEEVAHGRDESQHPLEPILNELRRSHGEIWVDLNQIQGERFVDDFIDSELNCLEDSFRKQLYGHTSGHALFTVELLRDMQERGDLAKDDAGYWSEGPDLDWDKLPTKVEGIIEARIGRLEDELREILTIAAVEGEEFTAQVIATIQQIQERKLLRTLSRELEKRHQLVREQKEDRIGALTLTRYRFAHALFQRYLYNDLSLGERRLLHSEIGTILEDLYSDRLDDVAIQLARHFTEGCNSKNAVKYLLLVGDSARTAFAYDEAIEAYVHALHFLTELEDHERAARTLMKLGLIYHNIFDFKSSREAYERGFAHQQLAAKRDISDSRTREPAPHPFRGVFSQAPTTLDPTHSLDTFSVWCINQLFSGLVQLTPEDELLPDIAQSWEMLDEGRKYIFHLRDDVVWSDGTPLTAADFEYSWKRTLSPDNSQGLPEILFDINKAKEYREGLLDDPEALGINAMDDYTLEVDLEGPSNCFLQIMALAISKPVPKHIVQRYGDDWSDPETLVTNGPFRLKSLIDDKELIFERSDTYHGRFGGNISRVDLIRVPDEEAIAMYERDELDIIDPYSHLSIPDGTRMIQLHPDEYISMPAPSTFYFVFDATRPPFDDARVRRALVLAIDRPAVYNQMAQAIVFPATGGMVPTGIIGHVPGIALPYDPELARARLAEGGYPEGRELPPVEVVALDSSLSREHLECFAVQWKEILGLHITVEFRNYATYYEQIKKTRPCIWMTGWTADYPDPDSFLRYDPWLQQSGWRNERYETLVQEAKRITDQDSRMDLYRQAEQILVDEAPVVPIYYGREHVLINTWVIGLPASVIAGNILKDIVIESH